MLHDAQAIRIDANFNSDRWRFRTRSFGQIIIGLIQTLPAKPSAMEIAAQQKYLSVVNETQDSINANMPARVRQQMHFC
jgi:hypothetical protein